MPKKSTEPIFIGCELIVRKGDCILLGKRKNCFGAGTWGLPGGHLEFGERLVEAACREAKEELGAHVTPRDLKLVSIADTLQPEAIEHHVHVTFELTEPSWEPRLCEPDACEEWRYFALKKLPGELFLPHKSIIANYLKNRLYA